MLVAASLIVLVAFLGLAIDGVMLLYHKRRLQNTADASMRQRWPLHLMRELRKHGELSRHTIYGRNCAWRQWTYRQQAA